jgi:hypothetical protein
MEQIDVIKRLTIKYSSHLKFVGSTEGNKIISLK